MKAIAESLIPGSPIVTSRCFEGSQLLLLARPEVLKGLKPDFRVSREIGEDSCEFTLHGLHASKGAVP